MKKVQFILSAFLLLILTSAVPVENNSKSGKDTGIKFHQGNWNDALKLAKEENKLVFLDISASWCGPCKMLKRNTFPDFQVGKFYNKNFINVEVDGEVGEGITLARKYKIRGYPTLLFVDSDGNVVAQTAGYRNPKQFLELGKSILKK